MKLDIKNYVDKRSFVKIFLKELIKNIYSDLLNESKDVDINLFKELFFTYVSNDETVYETYLKEAAKLKGAILEDIEFTYNSDPACNSCEEVLSTYPGFLAILYHRIAHIFYNLNFKVLARIISEDAHRKTGIDIHPGATIGVPFFIDHGTGIVIGETSIVGHHCKIYQGVTLGALSLSRGQQLKSTKRHPTIGNNVTIYAGASILGGDVVIGDDVVIGSNVFLLESVPAKHKVVLPKGELCLIKREGGKC